MHVCAKCGFGVGYVWYNVSFNHMYKLYVCIKYICVVCVYINHVCKGVWCVVRVYESYM